MRDMLLAVVAAAFLFAPVTRTFAQDASSSGQSPVPEGAVLSTGASQEAAPERSSPRAEEFASEPIVIETDLFTLELDVGVFFETYCYKPVTLRDGSTLDPCGEVLSLLDKHGVLSDVVAAIARRAREHAGDIGENVEANYRQQIKETLEQQAGELGESGTGTDNESGTPQ